MLQARPLSSMLTVPNLLCADMPEEIAAKVEEASKERLQDLTTALCKNTEVGVMGSDNVHCPFKEQLTCQAAWSSGMVPAQAVPIGWQVASHLNVRLPYILAQLATLLLCIAGLQGDVGGGFQGHVWGGASCWGSFGEASHDRG